MIGQLWQDCERRNCSNQPVCAACERCERHCQCGEELVSPEQQARQEAWTREDVERQRLFDPRSPDAVTPEPWVAPRGKRIRYRGGFNIYGSGEEFLVEPGGEFVWHLVNNGMDGDNWSLNNFRTGGAGAVATRYPLTSERRAFLEPYLPPDPPPLVESIARLLEYGAVDPALFPSGEAEILTQRPLAVWVRREGDREGGVRLGRSMDRRWIYLKIPAPLAQEHPWILDLREQGYWGQDNCSSYYLRLPATPERLTPIDPLIPAWVGTQEPGRYQTGLSAFRAYIADNAADMLRACAAACVGANEVFVTPGVHLVHADARILLWSDGVITRLPSVLGYWFWSHARDQQDRDQQQAERKARGEPTQSYDYNEPYLEAGFPPVPPLPEGGVTSLSEAATTLLQIAYAQSYWREEDRYTDLLTITDIPHSQTIEERQRDHGSWGTWSTLKRITVRGFGKETALQTLYLATMGWWSRGEDGETEEVSHLYLSRQEALAWLKAEETTYEGA